MSLELRFWGVRGSIPTPERENLGYGGNTACVEVRHDNRTRLVLDAGTGIRQLGLALMCEADAPDRQLHLFLTHFHWDHIQGLPFFAPLYQSARKLTFCSALPPASIERALHGQMRNPYFGAESAVRADCQYAQIGGDGLRLDSLLVRSFPLHHPGGSAGFRIEAPGGIVVYATDHEHDESADADALTQCCRDADLLIYDAQYTPREYESKKGWGHSTWLEATRLAREARVKQLVLFHHDPEHDDSAIAEIQSAAAAEFSNTIAAKEGLSIQL